MALEQTIRVDEEVLETLHARRAEIIRDGKDGRVTLNDALRDLIHLARAGRAGQGVDRRLKVVK